jgi:L-amino acid N-acyltransferase YncA
LEKVKPSRCAVQRTAAITKEITRALRQRQQRFDSFAERLVRATSLFEEQTALLWIGYFQSLTKQRFFARNPGAHLSIHLLCDKRSSLAPQ